MKGIVIDDPVKYDPMTLMYHVLITTVSGLSHSQIDAPKYHLDWPSDPKGFVKKLAERWLAFPEGTASADIAVIGPVDKVNKQTAAWLEHFDMCGKISGPEGPIILVQELAAGSGPKILAQYSYTKDDFFDVEGGFFNAQKV